MDRVGGLPTICLQYWKVKLHVLSCSDIFMTLREHLAILGHQWWPTVDETNAITNASTGIINIYKAGTGHEHEFSFYCQTTTRSVKQAIPRRVFSVNC